MNGPLGIEDLRRCVEGRIPPVIATVSASGEPNVVYLSSVHIVDAERIALSNQFLTKTARNLAENPRASVLLIDPLTISEYRLAVVYERTERRGPTFERLRTEVDGMAADSGMADVFRLRSADIYRVESIEVVYEGAGTAPAPRPATELLTGLGELTRRLARCGDLDTMVGAAVRGIDELLGYPHSVVMLLDERGERLFTIASNGFAEQGVGSEVALGEGVAGLAAARNQAVRVGGLRYGEKYAASIRRSSTGPSADIALPTLPQAQSRLAVPAVSRGQVLGVIVVESPTLAAFADTDETVLGVVGALIAEMADLERERADDPADSTDTSDSAGGTGGHLLGTRPATPATSSGPGDHPATQGETHVRFFASDGSVFLDGDYLIRGVAGRILWSLTRRHADTGQVEFTNKEIRLDKSLELPGFRDNLDTRLILLKRRLEERRSPIQIDKIGRGRIALRLNTSLRFEAHD